jgi:hypothetical protein
MKLKGLKINKIKGETLRDNWKKLPKTHWNNRHEKANRNNTLAQSVYKWARLTYVLGMQKFLTNHKDQWI